MDTRTVRRASDLRGAGLTGIAAGAVTLGTAELLAAAWSGPLASAGTPSPLLAVGAAFVDRTPAWLKDWAIAIFGTADKIALGVGMALVLSVVCAAVGLLATRRKDLAQVLFLAVAALGVAAVLSRPDSGLLDAVPTVVGAAVGTWLLGRLSDQGRAAQAGPVPPLAHPRRAAAHPGAHPGAHPAAVEPMPVGAPRREVLRTAGGLTALGLVGVAIGTSGSGLLRTAGPATPAMPLPRPIRTVGVPDVAGSSTPGHTAYLTPNDAFYRIDTALRVPRVNPETWTLRVTGLVEREIEMSYADLLAEQHVEALVTLTCVSNEVGGDLVGNARWQGWPVRDLLARAGVAPEADMVLSRSVDGWTAGTPLEALTDDRDALLAVAMNGEPLPARHGYPVRLVVPGLYGYVSATKWVTELKVTRFDADEGYWTPRGWSALGPIKTASRIDVPRTGARVVAGEVVVAGVAWAQLRGVDQVQVQVDDGPWQVAELLAEPSVDAWRLWRWTWPDATPGRHRLRVRATDATGEVQTDLVARPAPDGASGWHEVSVRVT
ncbi:molybdopterin-dependent oxidoreductase [Ornithinimicrobium pratense]|uniref:Molybdopterin-dependent oxidoreductase n=1 Tax=Ornithinimicrobium pratense TaxID=2593973 RepID=A0A5J6V3Z0_9MICO|nr:molybdopterin-dependent oxidoreductase [Ornithinimicrobium pratense]QFG67881.1 molybdopterin-dependent oxidoreductase [Ornithinimicrobium pratense]